ncbi:O-antigen ligase family protein [Spirosoma fluviale]|uniref:O-antigen ligase n=1 Tax=Spirosoma fluviale TaxID=1597977 RepID=A0A286G8F7_9BACT|nr:O-antigen ligase family protein [Spirosoma fluviale]SOD91813.1 O-antigen ligase [Spirosoma fluviale]
MEAVSTKPSNHYGWQPYLFENNLLSKIGTFEYVANIIILFFLSGALLYLLGGDGESGESTSNIANYIWVTFYLVMIYYIQKEYNAIKLCIKNNKYLLLLSLMVPLSVFWSQAPDISLRRSVSYFICLLYAFYVSERFKGEHILNLFFYTSCFIAIASMVFILLLPKYGLASGIHTGAWQGVYFHKNGLGRIAGLCLITTVLFYLENKRLKLLSFSVSVICFGLLIMSKSSTALLSFVFMIPIYVILKWNYKHYNLYKSIFNTLLLLFLIYVFIILFNTYSDQLFGGIGKDDSFSGRLPLWVMLMGYIDKSMLLGYGYSAFWVPKILANDIWIDATWAPQQGHNGFIDITLQLGVTGLAGLIIVLFKGFSRSVSLIKNNPDNRNYWYILILINLTIVSFTETFILKYNNIYWLMFLVCCMGIRKDLMVRSQK